MELQFIQQLEEGRALSRTSQLSKVGVEAVLRLLILELGAVVLFQHERAAQRYANDSMGSGAFNRWRFFGTDLYNAATALNSTEYRSKLGVRRGTINIPLLQKILRDASKGRAKNSDYAKFTMDAQRSFGISSTSLAGLRRRISDFEHLDNKQRRALFADMGTYYNPFGGESDMIRISNSKAPGSKTKSFLGWAVKTAALASAAYYLFRKK